MASFFEELKRRRVIKVSGLYLVSAWLILQVVDVIRPALLLPDWSVRFVLYLLILAFPLILVLAWHFDFTAEGLKQDTTNNPRGLRGLKSGLAFSLVVAIVGAGSIWFYGYLSSKADILQLDPRLPQASVAVLPFANVSDDPDQQYFSDGITEELINRLARLPGLRVTARTSSFLFTGTLEGADFTEIARQLNVTTLVEGSVRRVGNTVRVTAKLINAADGIQMWSESFDREITDIFVIQDEITAAIASALHVQLTLEGSIESDISRAASIDAYNLYLLGRYHFDKRSVFEFEEARRYFESAIERDPGYAPAYNGLVDSILLQSDAAYGSMPLEKAIEAALPMIEKSLELDPLLAETHASLGFLRMFEWDLLASEAALVRATELNPNLSQAYVWLYITQERAVQHRKAFETLQRAFALDPLSPIVNTNMAAEMWIRSRTNEALQAANRVIQIAPDGPLGYRRTGRIMWTSGEMSDAVSWYMQSIEISPDDRNSKLELGSLLVDLGLYEEAASLLGDQRYIAYLAQERVDEALTMVRALLEERPGHLGTVFAAAHAEARAGNFDRVRILLEPMTEEAEVGEGNLFLRSGIHFWDPQIAAMDLVVAMLETGDQEAGRALLSAVKSYFSNLKSEGLEHSMLRFQEARILALEEKPDEALAILRQIIAAGWRFWYLDGDPALRSLQENREFRSIVGDLNMLVAQERTAIDSDVFLILAQ